MIVRAKKGTWIGESSELNQQAINEIIVVYSDGDKDNEFFKDCEVRLPDGTWKGLQEAFNDHDIITDNYNTYFFAPQNIKDRNRGYTI